MDPQSAATLEGQELPIIHRHPTRQDLIRFAAASEDFASQHWDTYHMRGLGFPNVIVHGWLTLTYMCQAVTEWLPPERGTVLGYDARHKRPTFPGPLTCGGRVASISVEDGKTIVDVAMWAKDASGMVTTAGTMKLRLEA